MKRPTQIPFQGALFAIMSKIDRHFSTVILHRIYVGRQLPILCLLTETGSGVSKSMFIYYHFRFYFQTTPLIYFVHMGQFFIDNVPIAIRASPLCWGIKYSFLGLFSCPGIRFLGKALGAVVGYNFIHQLDKRYVFFKRLPAATGGF